MIQSEKTLLFDAMKTELLEKIRRLEEDRQNIDLSSGTHMHWEITFLYVIVFFFFQEKISSYVCFFPLS